MMLCLLNMGNDVKIVYKSGLQRFVLIKMIGICT
jgi:hypothetical protein